MKLSFGLVKIGAAFAMALGLAACATQPVTLVVPDCTDIDAKEGNFFTRPKIKATPNLRCKAQEDMKTVMEAGTRIGDVKIIAYALAAQEALVGEQRNIGDVVVRKIPESVIEGVKEVECGVTGVEPRTVKTVGTDGHVREEKRKSFTLDCQPVHKASGAGKPAFPPGMPVGPASLPDLSPAP